uniref:Large ribosomal subunit protein uL30 n=1 Tax=Candidatus Kentrum sp. TUN TaxID=2126343 RepID=A0A450ZNJ8_9GAMM|nr:MAG: large subunit ribosomal protein L30 [Candidatus Kentron sp. TUN]VFK57507.1 MAG: large subunit ribosomal protein L30 [Candidatus Kentron sp. TUN]VFK61306.1 MAG: large subunit ribosomal protein L30 [Candidatus Kentron sp. TUN]
MGNEDQSKGALRITLIRSKYGRLRKHEACLRGLGIRKIHKSVLVNDTPCVRGMINKVAYMLRVEEAKDAFK